MEEDEYDDELPPIVVNSSSRDESVFAMPSAEVLASQRARAEECERELQQLRAQHDLQEMELEAGSAENTPPTVPSRSDSSGSEGETALASAVEALRVGGAAAGAAAAESRPALGAVLARVLQQLPDTARALCAAYSDALTAGRDVDVLTDELLTGVGSWLGGLAGEEGGPLSESPTDDEVVGVGAWLSALALGAPGPRARRALHALLAAAADRQVHKLACVLVPALEEARWRLDLVTALQAAGRPQLALTLCQCALTQLLQPDRHAAMQVPSEPLPLPQVAALVAQGWRRLARAQREPALRLAGRALRAPRAGERERAARARALAALARAPADGNDRHQPEELKIAVAASKLKILLSDNN